MAIPTHLLTGTKNLFRHMILQNAGVYRRQAIETVVTSGMSPPVARALGSLLRTRDRRGMAAHPRQFALGFMQRHDLSVERDLTDACVQAYQSLKQDPDDGYPPRSQITEMHASLFAVG